MSFSSSSSARRPQAGPATGGSESPSVTRAREALEMRPGDRTARLTLARALRDTSQFEEARAHCRELLKWNPRDAEALVLLSHCQFDLKEFTADMPQLPEIQAMPAVLPMAATGTPHPAEKVDDRTARDLRRLLGNYKDRTAAWRQLGPEHVLRQLVCDNGDEFLRLKSKESAPVLAEDGLPLPPVALTMGYGAGDLDQYMDCGQRSHAMLTSILKEQGLTLGPGTSLLDWGCAAGRVVRQFLREAEEGCLVWGCDVDAPAIEWAQDHLSPPFRFFNGTAVPHLPMADRSFDFIYALSVFTHLVVFRDMWLLELARILKPGGCAVLTIHDEHCWARFKKTTMPDWVPSQMHHHDRLPAECIEIRGGRWDECYTFFHSNHIRRVWGRYLDVVDIKPLADSYQAAVVLRKS